MMQCEDDAEFVYNVLKQPKHKQKFNFNCLNLIW